MTKKRTAALCLLLFTAVFFTACTGGADTDAKTVIEMELTADYDDSDPFIHEKLFELPEDGETPGRQIAFEMKGETGLLEIADNETKDVIWSDSWSGNTEKTDFAVPLDGLQTEREYVIRFTGTGIEYAKITATADAGLVKERGKRAHRK